MWEKREKNENWTRAKKVMVQNKSVFCKSLFAISPEPFGIFYVPISHFDRLTSLQMWSEAHFNQKNFIKCLGSNIEILGHFLMILQNLVSRPNRKNLIPKSIIKKAFFSMKKKFSRKKRFFGSAENVWFSQEHCVKYLARDSHFDNVTRHCWYSWKRSVLNRGVWFLKGGF